MQDKSFKSFGKFIQFYVEFVLFFDIEILLGFVLDSENVLKKTNKFHFPE